MEQHAYQCHDISDALWSLLEPLLPGRSGSPGRLAHDNIPFFAMQFIKNVRSSLN